jgi:putative transposase
MLVTKKIRLEVSERDAATLEFMQGVYNWWVMRLRDGERWPGWEEAKKTLQASKEHDPELKYVYSKLLHEVYFRLDGAMQAFFQRVKSVEKPGFPRVRPRHCFFTLIYLAMYIKVEGMHITLPTGGGGKHGPKRFPDVKAKLTEEAPIGYKEVAISRDGQGHYYASFVHDEQEEIHEHNGVLALDLGVKMVATGVSDKGRLYHVGGLKGSRWYNRQLDKIRSKRDRCKKGSRRYRHLSQVYQRVLQQKRNKQNDSLHKASHLIAHKSSSSMTVLKVVHRERATILTKTSPAARLTDTRRDGAPPRSRSLPGPPLINSTPEVLLIKVRRRRIVTRSHPFGPHLHTQLTAAPNHFGSKTRSSR